MKAAILLTLGLGLAAVLSGCLSGGQCGANTHSNGLDFGCQVASKNGTMTYTFKNAFGAAQVTMGSQIASGTLTVTVKDGGGVTVFEQTYTGARQAGESSTRAGSPGTWTVVLKFQDVTGQIGLEVNGRATGGGGLLG